MSLNSRKHSLECNNLEDPMIEKKSTYFKFSSSSNMKNMNDELLIQNDIEEKIKSFPSETNLTEYKENSKPSESVESNTLTSNSKLLALFEHLNPLLNQKGSFIQEGFETCHWVCEWDLNSLEKNFILLYKYED